MKHWIARFAIVTSTALFVPAFAADESVALSRDELALIDQHATGALGAANPQFAAVTEASDSVLVDVTARRSDPWPEFGRSVAETAVPSCFDPRAGQDERFVTEGLLRMPFLLNAAADGACR